MDQGKCEKRKGSRKRLAAAFLALATAFAFWISWLSGPVLAQEGKFYIERLDDDHMLTDRDFSFFGYGMTDIYYWMKDDQTPLLCVQKRAQLSDGYLGAEGPEPIGNCKYFTDKQYELASIILQCCGLRRGEKGMLTPGEYLAGQASIWGIQSVNWTGTEQLKGEMEILYGHIKDWHGLSAAQIIDQSREMVEQICQGIDSYYGDTSPYIPAFASKYEDKSPVHLAEWQEDGSCRVVFSLEDKNEAIKEFEYQLPKGWNCKWEGNQVSFSCQEPEPGLVSITGAAPEGSLLEDAMPIGLIYIAGPAKYSTLQRLASYLDVNVPWSCYFKISVPEKPEKGTWYLPETRYYRHQEDFKALYGAELEKTDGDTKEPLTGVEFQVLEYFDSSQLKGTLLDSKQFQKWDGWKEWCPREMTDDEGKVRHQDRKEYHFEKTYCSGHPDPVIEYQGTSQEMEDQLEREAWDAWNEEAEACSQSCDYHNIEGNGKEELERDRNQAYEQFIHLKYGYTFKETKALEGYLPPQTDNEKIFCLPIQAVLPEVDKKPVYRMMRAAGTKSLDASKSNAVKRETERWKPGEDPGNLRKSSPSNGKRKGNRTFAPIWLTSLIEPLEQDMGQYADSMEFYQFHIKNYKPEIPKETTPEESTPGETRPEESSPEESNPEETTPEESSPEESNPEESMPEETRPQESNPEETRPQETLPEEPNPEETTQEEPTTETEKETAPLPTTPSPGGGGGGSRPPASPPPPSTADAAEPVLQKAHPPRGGWVTAVYTPAVLLDENGVPMNAREGKDALLPKTGQQGVGEKGWAIATVLFGLLSVWRLQKRKKLKRRVWSVSAVLILSGLFAASGSFTAQANQMEVVVYVPAEKETAITPQQQYLDEEGNEYYLDSCRLVETVKEESEERRKKVCSYKGLEEREQIPDRISASFWEDEEKRGGTGELERTRVLEISSYWADGFAVPITFYDYGADFYYFQDTQVPKGGELDFLLENQQLLFDEIGCRAERYQIETILWDGEGYDSQGIFCRNALAVGKKLLSDYTVEYEGMIQYPEIRQNQWEVVYRPVVSEILLETAPVTRPEPETRPVIERNITQPAPNEQIKSSPGTVWKNFRTLVIYSISLAVLLPIMVYLFFIWKKCRHGQKEEKMPEDFC